MQFSGHQSIKIFLIGIFKFKINFHEKFDGTSNLHLFNIKFEFNSLKKGL